MNWNLVTNIVVALGIWEVIDYGISALRYRAHSRKLDKALTNLFDKFEADIEMRKAKQKHPAGKKRSTLKAVVE